MSENNILQIIRYMGSMKILIQGIHNGDILILNIELKNIGIGSNAVRVHGFGNYGNSLLDGPAKPDLCRRVGVFGAKDAHYIIVKVSPSCQRGISLYLNALGLTVFDQLLGIAQGVTFDLVHSGNNDGSGNC